MQFYVVFPFAGEGFQKVFQPDFSAYVRRGDLFPRPFGKHLERPCHVRKPAAAFFDVFAIGMFGAYAFVYMNKKINYQNMSPLFTIISLGSLVFVLFAMKDLAQVMGNENLQRWQGINRTWVSLGFLLFLVSTTYSMKWYRAIYTQINSCRVF